MSTVTELKAQLQKKRDALKMCEGQIQQIETQLKAEKIEPAKLPKIIERLKEENESDEQRLAELISEVEELLRDDS